MVVCQSQGSGAKVLDSSFGALSTDCAHPQPRTSSHSSCLQPNPSLSPGTASHFPCALLSQRPPHVHSWGHCSPTLRLSPALGYGEHEPPSRGKPRAPEFIAWGFSLARASPPTWNPVPVSMGFLLHDKPPLYLEA